jgi:membrane protein required for colicin V production
MAHLPFTLFDVAVVAVILVSTVLALSRGLIREVVALASWVGAAAIAWYGFGAVRPLVKQAIASDLFADLATGAGLFIVALIVLKLVGAMVASGVRDIGLGPIDHVLGFAFGLARGVAFVCAAWLVASAVIQPDRQPDWVRGALLLPSVERGAEWLQQMLPARITADSREAAAKADQGARQLDSVRRMLGTDRTPPSGDKGYTDDQRRQMDKMFRPGG